MSHLNVQILNQQSGYHWFQHADPYRMLLNIPKTENPHLYNNNHLLSLNKSNNKTKTSMFTNIPYRTSSVLPIAPMPEPNESEAHESDDNDIDMDIDDVSSIASDDSLQSEFKNDKQMRDLYHIPSPPPYQHPQDPPIHINPHGYNTRFQQQQIQINKPPHKKLVIPRKIPLKGHELRNKDTYNKREYLRAEQKRLNQSIIDQKPYEFVYNANLLLPY